MGGALNVIRSSAVELLLQQGSSPAVHRQYPKDWHAASLRLCAVVGKADELCNITSIKESTHTTKPETSLQCHQHVAHGEA